MRVTVLFFGVLKEVAQRGSMALEFPDGATVSSILERCVSSSPALSEFKGSLAVAVNQQYAGPETVVWDGDEIALLPPVSGGSGARAQIVRHAIDTRSVVAGLKRPEDGACVVFEGIVRNHTRGRRTLYLDYEAYEEMAIKQMEQLLVQALAEYKVRDAAIVHRLGRLEIGETSVLIVVCSAHRAAAFDANRWLIDSLKRTVPIWKKEYFEDGAVWADGEPFPGEVSPMSSSGIPGSRGERPASK
jgi:molybdopterin converting factor subunit 1